MNNMLSHTPAPGPVELAGTLVEALGQEQGLLEQLAGQFDLQLEALRHRRHDLLEQATLDITDVTHRLDRLRKQREQKTRLLGRALQVEGFEAPLAQLAEMLASRTGGAHGNNLLEARAALRAQAQATQARCEEAEFALKHAAQLGRDLIEATQGLTTPPPTRVYTAKGAAAPSAGSRHAFLNKVG